MSLQRLYLPQSKSEEVVTILGSPLFPTCVFSYPKWPLKSHELIIKYLFLISIRLILLDYVFNISFAVTGIVRVRFLEGEVVLGV